MTAASRSPRDPINSLDPRQRLDAPWLGQLCLNAGADDVGLVEIARPALDDQRDDVLKFRAPIETLESSSVVSAENRSELWPSLWPTSARLAAMCACMAIYGLVVLAMGRSGVTSRLMAQTTGANKPMTSSRSFTHISLSAKEPYAQVTRNFEAQLGQFDLSVLQQLADGAEPAAIQKKIEGMAGPNGMMIISSINHGALLRIVGREQRAKLYEVGNPLFALEMTKHDLRAGLYAPLRVLIYETSDGTTQIEYDRPSDLFGQFQNQDVDRVAKLLDAKLESITAAALCH